MKTLTVIAVACGLLVVGSAAADEAKTPIMLNLMAPPPTQSYDSIFNEAMRAKGPRPRSVAALGGELQPDGSVKYGDVSVTIKNPCPEGTAHYEPPPLPGRRPRR